MGDTERTDRRDGSPLAWLLLAAAIVAVLMLVFLARRTTAPAAVPTLPPALKPTRLPA